MSDALNSPERVVVVGGGLAGLSIAVRLAQKSLPVMLLEASTLGHAASTLNQGWLYSGGWFARRDATLAKQCYEAFRETVAFCPECLEPGLTGMSYILPGAGASEADDWLCAWKAAGIPYEPVSQKQFKQSLPEFRLPKGSEVFRLPDRAFRPDVLLEKLVGMAQSAGVEIKTGVRVAGLMKQCGTVAGVTTSRGVDIAANLVILATGALGAEFWHETTSADAGAQNGYARVALKTHLVATSPPVADEPFCVLDEVGLSHVPHGNRSVFGLDRWTIAKTIGDTKVEANEVVSIWDPLQRHFPNFKMTDYDCHSWAGTTVQALEFDQIEQGRATRPTVIDHGDEPPRLNNLLSVYPGRATLWPQLADETCRLAIKRFPDRVRHDVASPPWAVR